MFEIAEVGSQVSQEEYEAQVPHLRVDLINAQYDLRSADFPILVLIVGDDHQGCNAVLNLLHEWMDARYLDTHVFGALTEEEQERPRFWRYWRTLPRKGQLGVYVGAWARNAVADRVQEKISDREFERRTAHIARFEQALVDDGALVLKFWLHLPKKALKRQVKKNNKGRRKDEEGRQIYKFYDEALPLGERLIRKTSTGNALWHVVETTDEYYRNLTVARVIRDSLTARLAAHQAAKPKRAKRTVQRVAVPEVGVNVLETVDLTVELPWEDYKKTLDKLQDRLRLLSQRAREQGVSSVLVFEGWDAAGKGGVIRRITRALDAADYRIVPIAAPSEEEKAHHYLWRFWQQLPRAGSLLIFDRSWYGRVLVERVEGLARADEWQRAYSEINDFEEQLVERGTVVLKFWLHIDPATQLRRFKEREKTPYKKYKLTAEDYRNREKWDDYVVAVNEMVARTSTDMAPWKLVAANDKRGARVEVLQTICQGLKQALKSSGR
ncbi:MAG: polyphosphate:AMP phosphotransferase [Deltaproteobacteria bacterium]|nr:polyphosphate:AMP phosphotransferase [Deltaproteobacteria bacterium]